MSNLPRRKDDTGFTLVELAVYSLMVGVVIAIIAGLIISVTMTQRTISSVSAASSEAQAASDSIATGIRNSSSFKLTSTSTAQALQARIAQGSGTALTWVCAAWYYSVADGTVRYHQSTTQIPAITATSTSSWGIIASGLSPVSSGKIFFEARPTLSISFTAAADGNPPARVSTKVTVPTKWKEDTCFTTP
jgi:type II secretory pathway pseudopilin PulG